MDAAIFHIMLGELTVLAGVGMFAWWLFRR
jgi:hypothetical protein